VLPEGLSESFWNDLKTYEEERKMTYVTSVEKIGFKRGEQETRKEIALKLLGKGMSVEDVASATELSINQVQELQAQ
jgi:predicted transposase/invertase (TIGR01784 family)